MKTLIRIKLTALVLIFNCLHVKAQQLEARSIKVLLIGNSFSQNATRYLPQMAKEAQIDLVLGHAEMGGCSLKRHWDSVVVNNADSTRGLAYNGRSLRQLLRSQKWDVVTLQQYSLLSGDPSTYQPYAQNLYNLIKQYQPKAKIMIHQTWAYRADATKWGEVGDGKKANNMKEMWHSSRTAYRKLANALGGLPIIPSGDAFYSVSTHPKWGFVKDTAFIAANAVYPELPHDLNSLNVGYSWSKDRKIAFDPNHANDTGCYLAGLIWYRFVLHEDPAGVRFVPPSVREDLAAYLKRTAVTVSAALK
jgi:hypothetical protein